MLSGAKQVQINCAGGPEGQGVPYKSVLTTQPSTFPKGLFPSSRQIAFQRPIVLGFLPPEEWYFLKNTRRPKHTFKTQRQEPLLGHLGPQNPNGLGAQTLHILLTSCPLGDQHACLQTSSELEILKTTKKPQTLFEKDTRTI